MAELYEKIDTETCPVLKKTISKIVVFNNAPQNKYALYIEETDRSIMISESCIDLIIEISKLTNGNNSIKKIVASNNNDDKEIIKSIMLMYKLHLFDDSKESQQFSEASLLSKKIFNFPFNISDKSGILFYYFYWSILLFLTFILGLYALQRNLLTESHVHNNINGFNGIGYFLSFIFNIPIFILHEFAHVATACKYGINKKLKINFALYLYVFPYVYVKIPGLYKLNRSKRVHILASGVIANFFLGTICIIINLITDNSIFLSLAVSNFQIAIVNLMPFNLTDGYFIFSNLLKRTNLRKQYFTFISNLGKKIRVKFDKVELAYLIVSVCYLVGFINFESKLLISSFSHEYNKTQLFLLSAFFTIIAIMVYIIFIKLRVRKVRDNINEK